MFVTPLLAIEETLAVTEFATLVELVVRIGVEKLTKDVDGFCKFGELVGLCCCVVVLEEPCGLSLGVILELHSFEPAFL